MLLSVIIPVYNQELWLEPCLESLRVQVIPDAEFLVVDDGSTDRSAEIIQSFVREDFRFRLIPRENGGYGAAVNTGLDAAVGEWVGIVESDDECYPHMYARLLDAAAAGKADVVKGGFSDIDESGNIIGRGNPLFRSAFGEGLFHAADEPELYVIHHSLWSAVYRRSFLDDNHVRCPENRGGYQDAGFAISLWLKNPTVIWMDEPVYRYRRFRTGNTMGSGGGSAAAVAVLNYIADGILVHSKDVPPPALGAAIRGLMSTGTWHLLRLWGNRSADFVAAFAGILEELRLRCPEAWMEAEKMIQSDRLRSPLIRGVLSRRRFCLAVRIRLIRVLSGILAEGGTVRRLARRYRHAL
jgi:hypothetical protein